MSSWKLNHNSLKILNLYLSNKKGYENNRRLSHIKDNNITKPIYFLHIMKCGGTSIDSLMSKLVEEKIIGRYIGHKHFDYSYINSKEVPSVDIEFITMLRDPVSRAVSNFYFSKTGKWTNNFIMRNQTFSEYIRDDKSMKQYRPALRDGEGGYFWLSGVHPGVNWVLTSKKNKVYKNNLINNKKKCLTIAAKNLDKTLWFGLMEDIPRSMELLKHIFGLKIIPKLPNKNKNKYNNITEDDKKIVEEHLKGDIWLYKYSKLLFEARWNKYKGYPYIHPILPDFDF